jgi:ketosteroid isomerase-like protein
MRPEDLDLFFHEGWNRHDVEMLMTFMSDDCVFESASGLEAYGTRHAGRRQVREAFARIFATFPDVTFRDVRQWSMAIAACRSGRSRARRARAGRSRSTGAICSRSAATRSC